MSLAGGLESTAYGVRQVTRMRSDPSASVYGEWRPHESLALRLTWSNGGRMQTDSWLYALPREAGQSADLDYLAATWSPPTWQARAAWTPTSLARGPFGARSAERWAGEGGVRPCRFRLTAGLLKKKKKHKQK